MMPSGAGRVESVARKWTFDRSGEKPKRQGKLVVSATKDRRETSHAFNILRKQKTFAKFGLEEIAGPQPEDTSEGTNRSKPIATVHLVGSFGE
jgi:hypothetical protein